MAGSVLNSYRELVRLLHRLPWNERTNAMQEARHEMRKHVTASQEEVADLHRLLVGKISFLRMKVPKRHRDASAIGSGHYIVRNGKVVHGKADQSTPRCCPSRFPTRAFVLSWQHKIHTRKRMQCNWPRPDSRRSMATSQAAHETSVFRERAAEVFGDTVAYQL